MSIPSEKTIPTAQTAPAPPPRAVPAPLSSASGAEPIESVRSIPSVSPAPQNWTQKTISVPGTSKTITVPTSVSAMKAQIDPYLQSLPDLKTLPKSIPTNPVALYRTTNTLYKQTRSTLEPIVAPLIAPLFVDDAPSRQRNFARIQQLCTLLDAKYKIPIVGITVGIDPLISAVPVIGDVVSTVLSAYIVYLTRRFKVPWTTTARMVLNVALNGSVGAIPWVGSLFDVAYKPNLRNLQLLEQHLRTEAIEKFNRDPAEVDAALARAREGLVLDDNENNAALPEGKGKGKATVGGGSFLTPKEDDFHLPAGFYPDVREDTRFAGEASAAKAEGYQKLYPDVASEGVTKRR
ncbi:hypothetical protein HK097_005771 [Rhizophlyctis rosea]|uniref:Uncharacterized protein n=1 Tax=Rhizophlyctis rosea TaxID=64517 RepID=A0AAD5SGG0_9FUNG|nr:hypothetical protein HK097_005771 [Rhizophlyctis rosea]